MSVYITNGLDELITNRYKLAVYLSDILKKDSDFAVLNNVEINSVAFFYTGGKNLNVEEVNHINKAIYAKLIREGEYYIHQFSIPDIGLFEKGALVYPLRFMCGNPNVKPTDVDDMIGYIRKIGQRIR